ncbi:MAG: hypothetical protein HYZ11_02930 [Candidatus Tectomicrobia bacterium]|uniref:Uncharacterized protein n=1 Tax=Tectimicrobiota bacterium TaxID=2528274 RepID=A0A932HVP1_UNCTE|nr:hypothetical protein [Candidatus Tectomicrobia bacterium]
MEWLVMGLILFLVAFSIYYPQLPYAASVYGRFRRPRRLVCPATGERVPVQIDAARAARKVIFSGAPELRVKDCARWWNGEKDCRRECIGRLL